MVYVTATVVVICSYYGFCFCDCCCFSGVEVGLCSFLSPQPLSVVSALFLHFWPFTRTSSSFFFFFFQCSINFLQHSLLVSRRSLFICFSPLPDNASDNFSCFLVIRSAEDKGSRPLRGTDYLPPRAGHCGKILLTHCPFSELNICDPAYSSKLCRFQCVLQHTVPSMKQLLFFRPIRNS